MRIVKKFCAQVCFGSDRYKVGPGGWEMVTFNEQHLWVSPLVPAEISYKKSYRYFGKLRKRKLRHRKSREISVGNLAVTKVVETKTKNVEELE